MRGRVHAPQVHLRTGERADRGEHHRERLRRTAGEHRVDGDDAAGDDPGAGEQGREHFVGIADGVLEHGVDPRRRRRDDRQAVAQAAGLEQLGDRLGRVVGDLDGARRVGGHGVLTCLMPSEYA